MHLKPTSAAGRVPLWLPLLALLLGVSVLLVLYPQGGAGRAEAEPEESRPHTARGPEAAEFEGPDTTPPAVRELPRPEGPPDRVFVSSGATEGTVRGRVLLSAGLPWPQGAVTLELKEAAAKAPLQVRGVRAEQATFEFDPVPFGAYRLTVHADGCQTQTVLLSLSDATPDIYQQMVLEPDARILGILRDRDGRPVVGAEVTAMAWTDPPRSGIPVTVRSGPEGRFALRGLPPGDYEVFPGSLQYPLGEAKRVLLAQGSSEAWAELEVPPLGSARIVLVDEKGGHDLSQVRVQATLRAEGGQPGYGASQMAGADGELLFTGLPPGDYAFQAYGGVFRRTARNLAVRAAEQAELSIALLPFRKEPDGR